MKAREAPSSPDLPVDPRLVNILLLGVAHDPTFDTLEYFVSGQADELRPLWQRHRVALIAEGVRRGLQRPLWGEVRFEQEGAD